MVVVVGSWEVVDRQGMVVQQVEEGTLGEDMEQQQVEERKLR